MIQRLFWWCAVLLVITGGVILASGLGILGAVILREDPAFDKTLAAQAGLMWSAMGSAYLYLGYSILQLRKEDRHDE